MVNSLKEESKWISAILYEYKMQENIAKITPPTTGIGIQNFSSRGIPFRTYFPTNRAITATASV